MVMTQRCDACVLRKLLKLKWFFFFTIFIAVYTVFCRSLQYKKMTKKDKWCLPMHLGTVLLWRSFWQKLHSNVWMIQIEETHIILLYIIIFILIIIFSIAMGHVLVGSLIPGFVLLSTYQTVLERDTKAQIAFIRGKVCVCMWVRDCVCLCVKKREK